MHGLSFAQFNLALSFLYLGWGEHGENQVPIELVGLEPRVLAELCNRSAIVKQVNRNYSVEGKGF